MRLRCVFGQVKFEIRCICIIAARLGLRQQATASHNLNRGGSHARQTLQTQQARQAHTGLAAIPVSASSLRFQSSVNCSACNLLSQIA